MNLIDFIFNIGTFIIQSIILDFININSYIIIIFWHLSRYSTSSWNIYKKLHPSRHIRLLNRLRSKRSIEGYIFVLFNNIQLLTIILCLCVCMWFSFLRRFSYYKVQKPVQPIRLNIPKPIYLYEARFLNNHYLHSILIQKSPV